MTNETTRTDAIEKLLNSLDQPLKIDGHDITELLRATGFRAEGEGMSDALKRMDELDELHRLPVWLTGALAKLDGNPATAFETASTRELCAETASGVPPVDSPEYREALEVVRRLSAARGWPTDARSLRVWTLAYLCILRDIRSKREAGESASSGVPPLRAEHRPAAGATAVVGEVFEFQHGGSR